MLCSHFETPTQILPLPTKFLAQGYENITMAETWLVGCKYLNMFSLPIITNPISSMIKELTHRLVLWSVGFKCINIVFFKWCSFNTCCFDLAVFRQFFTFHLFGFNQFVQLAGLRWVWNAKLLWNIRWKKNKYIVKNLVAFKFRRHLPFSQNTRLAPTPPPGPQPSKPKF